MIKIFILLTFLAISCQTKENTMLLNSLFSDGMVLQQKEKVAFWGTSKPNQKVEVIGSWGTKSETTSDNDGEWVLYLDTPKAGGPFNIIVSSVRETVTISDVLIGEVWLAAGQSNMEMTFSYCCNSTDSAEYEISTANYPNIRMFNVKKQYSLEPTKIINGAWSKAVGDNIINFSAAGYFFAKKLHKEINVPIGIIHASWGGSDAESWISSEKLITIKGFEEESSSKTMEILSSQMAEKWFSKFKSVKMPSSGFDLTLGTYFEKAAPDMNYFNYFINDWRNIDYKDTHYIIEQNNFTDWAKIKLPGSLSNVLNTNDFSGVIILKNEFIIDNVQQDYYLNIEPVSLGWAGDLREYDFYINGIKIGSTFGDKKKDNSYKSKLGENYKEKYKSNPFTHQLKQLIPDSTLKIGNNEIAIRLIGSGDIGAISMESNEAINLFGNPWHYKISAEIYKQLDNYEFPYSSFFLYDDSDIDLTKRPSISSYNFNEPSSLFNGMINPLVPYSIKGIIWYQGENNAFRFDKYEEIFTSLIEDWREKWHNDLPFYYVQIAPYFNYYGTNASLREAQRNTLKIPKTGMVVTLDIGENYDIHPSNKHDVGYRLAGLALTNDYNQNNIASGPLYRDFEISGNKILVNFDYVGSGLTIRQNQKSEFEIAGTDEQFFPAQARILNNRVEVFAMKVTQPKHVRYGWSDTTSATLFNIEGLPASSFSSN
jgi:sialate O-acetylesterase